jgi:flagellin
MASTINTNINSLTAQRNLGMSQASLTTSMQRLSSGLRINSAKDDAAGLAISERMTSQIRGLSQASRNANDGISLAQTAEGALGEINSNLQRIRELAVQSANSTNTASDRASLNLEVQQRLAEIDRVSAQTTFNGQKILDGSFGTGTFQVGSNVGETISLDLSSSMRNTNLGKTADYAGSVAYDGSKALGAQGAGTDSTGVVVADDVTISVGSGTAVKIPAAKVGTAAEDLAGKSNTSAYAKAEAIKAANIGGLTVEANTSLKMAYTTTTSTYSLVLNGADVFTSAAAGLTGADAATAINSYSGTTGVTAKFENGNMTLTSIEGRDISINQTTGAGTDGLGAVAAGDSNDKNVTTFTGVYTSGTARVAVGTIRLAAADRIGVAETTSGEAAKLGLEVKTLVLGSNSLKDVSVSTVSNANIAINTVDSAMTSVNTLRATFGAMQNRFDSVIANLGTSVENLSASRSRIQDADFASETANLSRSQILQQAGTAMVAQANQLPQGVLALLR